MKDEMVRAKLAAAYILGIRQEQAIAVLEQQPSLLTWNVESADRVDHQCPHMVFSAFCLEASDCTGSESYLLLMMRSSR